MPARHAVTAADVLERRLVRDALLRRERAARVEPAPGRRVKQVGRLTLEGRQPATRAGDRRRGPQEEVGVWMLRSGEDVLSRAVLDQLAGVHHAKRIGHL